MLFPLCKWKNWGNEDSLMTWSLTCWNSWKGPYFHVGWTSFPKIRRIREIGTLPYCPLFAEREHKGNRDPFMSFNSVKFVWNWWSKSKGCKDEEHYLRMYKVTCTKLHAPPCVCMGTGELNELKYWINQFPWGTLIPQNPYINILLIIICSMFIQY